MNASMQDHGPNWKTSTPVPSQLTDIRMATDQLWTRTKNANEGLEKVWSMVNTDIPQSKIVAILKGIFGHSTSMPDYKGENDDHDQRYVQKIFLNKIIRLENGIVKIGSADNYFAVDSSGNIVLVGNATSFDDAQGPLIGQRLESPSSDVVTNNAEGTIDYETGATMADYMDIQIQISHSWKLGTVRNPHLHWFQASANVPNWLIQYRWQINGAAKTTAWTPLKYTTHIYTYSTGTILQISKFGTITPPVGYQMSDILQYRIIRDTTNASTLFSGADPLSATVSALSFDDHYEKDGFGSNTEYSK